MLIEVEALLQLQGLRASSLLLHLGTLCFLCFQQLLTMGVSLSEFLRRDLLVPSPFLLELLVDEANAPAGLLVDLFEDLEDFFLLFAVGEDLCSMSQRSYRHGRDATVIKSVTIRKGYILQLTDP